MLLHILEDGGSAPSVADMQTALGSASSRWRQGLFQQSKTQVVRTVRAQLPDWDKCNSNRAEWLRTLASDQGDVSAMLLPVCEEPCPPPLPPRDTQWLDQAEPWINNACKLRASTVSGQARKRRSNRISLLRAADLRSWTRALRPPTAGKQARARTPATPKQALCAPAPLQR